MTKRDVNPETIRHMEQTAKEIGRMLIRACQGPDGQKHGFALFLFGFHDDPEMTYISNANREDMVKTLQEFIDRNPPAKKWDDQTIGEQRGH